MRLKEENTMSAKLYRCYAVYKDNEEKFIGECYRTSEEIDKTMGKIVGSGFAHGEVMNHFQMPIRIEIRTLNMDTGKEEFYISYDHESYEIELMNDLSCNQKISDIRCQSRREVMKMSDKSICANCVHCDIKEFWRPKPFNALFSYRCKITSRMIPEKIDYVTGKVTKAKFGSCLLYNLNGECSEFEKGE